MLSCCHSRLLSAKGVFVRSGAGGVVEYLAVSTGGCVHTSKHKIAGTPRLPRLGEGRNA